MYINIEIKNLNEQEQAILIGVESSAGSLINGRSEEERSIDELEELSRTAGVKVLGKVIQKRSEINSVYYVGKGKLEEIKSMIPALDVNILIFNDELTGAQIRNIEKFTEIKVIDRTTLILDIFALRAKSKEGKIQVELAQLKYRLPRLTGFGNQLSRLGGGIGTRGPGEKKLEVDKRHIRRRIKSLEDELEAIRRRRNLVRQSRKRTELPTIAVVGYTNTGKSTLINSLCKADVFAEDKLFATLDPTTRKLILPNDRIILLTDTVGFIRKLPHDLVDAFKSTLEEAVFADALIHVVDVSSDEVDEQISVVNQILGELGAINKPIITVFNKVDLLVNRERLPIDTTLGKVCETSAITGEGLVELVNEINAILPVENIHVNLLVPYNNGWVIPYIYENGKIIKKELSEDGIRIKAEIKKLKVEKLTEYIQ